MVAVAGQVRPRWLMQAVLWLVLAGTLGLAALVQQHFRHRQHTRLGQAHRIGAMELRPPIGWTERQRVDGVVYEEPNGRTRGRRLEIWYTPGNTFVSPLEHLIRSGEIRPADAAAILATRPANQAADLRQVRTIPIAGWPGVVLSQTRVLRTGPARQALRSRQTLACTILPSGHAIVLRLEGEGAADATDDDLVRRLAESIQFQDQSQPLASAEIELAGEIHMRIPPALATAAGSDRFRVARSLICTDPAGGWLGVDVAPCVLLSADIAETISATMILRDPLFRIGEIRQLDERTWVCRRGEDLCGPAVVYLRTNPDGRAVLAEFRWDGASGALPVDQARIDSLWTALSDGIRFAEGFDVARLVGAAQTALGKLPKDPAELLKSARPEGRWQWYHETSARESWTRVNCRITGETVEVDEDTDAAPPLSGGGRQVGRWGMQRDSSEYHYSLLRAGSLPALSQETRVRNLHFETVLADAAGLRVRSTGAAGANYLPGGLLPWALGRLPFEPMILCTESLPSPFSVAWPVPQAIALEPSFDIPRFLPGDLEPMRCWLVRVSGSSQSSRWYLDHDGRLHSISFSGGIHVQRYSQAPATRAAGQEEGAMGH